MENKNCPQCGSEKFVVYHRGEPAPKICGNADMDMALGDRDEMTICLECGFDQDADF
jgi:hypothetical protein